MTYPEDTVADAINRLTVPVQYDSTVEASAPVVERYRHVWTPDIRILDSEGYDLAHWNGYLPPYEFVARLLTETAFARLRLRQYHDAISLYEEVLRRFPTSAAAAEAIYFLGVAQYRANPAGDDLRKQWRYLQSRFPESEWRIKQSFIEQ